MHYGTHEADRKLSFNSTANIHRNVFFNGHYSANITMTQYICGKSTSFNIHKEMAATVLHTNDSQHTSLSILNSDVKVHRFNITWR